MIYWRFVAFLFFIFALTSCGIQSYEQKFFLVSDVPPKFDNTICDGKIGYLFGNAEKHTDFLIEQVKNLEKIGLSSDAITYIEIESSYYPIAYRRSDIANYILSYRYGSISSYYPDFQSNMRIKSTNSEALRSYVNELHRMWASLVNNRTLTPIKGICDK